LLLPFPQFDNVAMAEPDNRNSIYQFHADEGPESVSLGRAGACLVQPSPKLIDNTNSEINWLEASPVGWNDANVNNLRGEEKPGCIRRFPALRTRFRS